MNFRDLTLAEREELRALLMAMDLLDCRPHEANNTYINSWRAVRGERLLETAIGPEMRLDWARRWVANRGHWRG